MLGTLPLEYVMSYLILEIKNKNISAFVINFLYVWKNGMNTDKENNMLLSTYIFIHMYQMFLKI